MKKIIIFILLMLSVVSCEMTNNNVEDGILPDTYTVDDIIGKTYQYSSIKAEWADYITEEEKETFISESGDDSELKYLTKIEVNAEMLFAFAQGITGKNVGVFFENNVSCIIDKETCDYSFENNSIKIKNSEGSIMTFYMIDENSIYKYDDSFEKENGVILRVIYTIKK